MDSDLLIILPYLPWSGSFLGVLFQPQSGSGEPNQAKIPFLDRLKMVVNTIDARSKSADVLCHAFGAYALCRRVSKTADHPLPIIMDRLSSALYCGWMTGCWH
jgi:hypothetical protein